LKTRLLFTLLLTIGATAFAQGPAYPYNVGLSCTPPASGTVTGYNFYRAAYASSACGSFSKLNASPATGCSYTDANPPQGTYCYEATSLDGSNNESGPDLMPGQVSIPPPPPTGLGATVSKNGGAYDVIFAWTNPAGAIEKNTLYFSGKAQVRTTGEVAGLRMYAVPKGSYSAAVTASAAAGESGLSKAAKFTVP
jgi:hypothetical protein